MISRTVRPLRPAARGGMLVHKPGMLVRVALASKLARIVWALMVRGGVYKAPAATA